MSKVIVPIHLGNLEAVPSPSSVQPGFKLLYLRLNWLKLYNGLTEQDLVLGRPLDNYVPTPGVVTDKDNVFTALEKLQYQITTSTGVINQDNKLPIIPLVRFDLPKDDATPYTTLISNWLLTQTFVITEIEIPYFTFIIIYDNNLANINNLKLVYLWGDGKGTFPTPTISSMRLISVSQLTLSDIEGGGNVTTYDLGTLTTGVDFITIINDAIPSYDFSDPTKTYLVNFIQDGYDYFYHFIGAPGLYGDADLQAASLDFVVLNDKPKITSPYIQVIYAELVQLIIDKKLELDMTYLITDYRTTYIQPITNIPCGGVGQPNENPVEPLYVKAAAPDKLYTFARSYTYPQDIVYYEVTGDLGDGNGTEGFTKGKIYRRVDTIRNNDIGTDWRHIKYKRGTTDLLLFEDYTDVYDNKIETYFLFNTVLGNGVSHNNLYYISGNTIGNAFSSNTIENMENNTIGVGMYDNRFYYFNQNIVGSGFSTNIGNQMSGCTVNASFWYNIISNNLIGKDLTGISELYGKNYTHIITLKPNNTYQFTYTDSFGDIIIEDIP